MHLEDIYVDFPETMTELEKRESNDADLLEKLPPCLWPSIVRPREGLNDDVGEDEYGGLKEFGITPKGFRIGRFDKRKPAFGWGAAELEEIESFAAKSKYHEFLIFHKLRGHMSKRLICASGAKTTSDLLQIRRNEMESGVPAPVPSWYKVRNSNAARCGTPGDNQENRRIGYALCTARNCPNTETLDKQFDQCMQCKLAVYCSRECQVQDWMDRHNKVCKSAKEWHDMTQQAASVLNRSVKLYEVR